MNLLIEKNGKALEKEKKGDFRKVVILQSLIIFSALLLKDTLELCGISESFILRDSLFLLLGGLYVLVLWDLLRNFSQNRILIYALLIFIMGTYILALVTVNPFYKIFPEHEQRPYLFYIHSVLFLVEAIVIYVSIIGIFKGNRLSEEKVWGSACIYIMIALAFGSLFDLINILKPGCMGTPIQLGLTSYTECIYHSMSILAGQDSVYQNVVPLVRNIGIAEGVWGNLFIVLLVGRLLSQPE